MKKIIIFIFLYFLFTQMGSANNYVEKTVDGHKIKIIKYDLTDPRYTFKIGVNPDYKATNLRSMMLRFNGISAVNGVFLCPADYGECGGKNFTHNERYFKGHKIGGEFETGKRVVFAISKNNKAFLYQTDKINPANEKAIYYGFGNFPLFLENGESRVENYKLDYKMSVKSKRNFICSDKDSAFILTGYIYNISLGEMPDFLKGLGCYNALNLDAGATSSMIYNGRQIIGPGRLLLDGVVIERKGLDTKKITKQVQDFIKIFVTQGEKKSAKENYEKTKKLLKKTASIRHNLYNKNSVDLFDKKGKKIGYEIQMNKLSDLQTMFLINSLEYEFQKLNWKYKKETEKDKSAESGLF